MWETLDWKPLEGGRGALPPALTLHQLSRVSQDGGGPRASSQAAADPRKGEGSRLAEERCSHVCWRSWGNHRDTEALRELTCPTSCPSCHVPSAQGHAAVHQSSPLIQTSSKQSRLFHPGVLNTINHTYLLLGF